MPTRPDLRDIAHNVRDALGDCDRDTLLDLLTFVLKEYVVEGPPPMLVHQTETIADLQGLSFAQLVSALQTRLDTAELSLFAVDGEQVSVRVGGVMQPLVASRTATPAAELPRPAAGVRVVEAPLTQQRPAPQPPVSTAPRPAAGLSVRGQPTGSGGGGGAPARPPEGAPAPAAPPAAAAPAAPEKPAADGDDAAARFSLLELD